MGDHDIGWRVKDWYPLIGDLESTQLIVMSRAGHALIISTPNLWQNISLISSRNEVIRYDFLLHY